jgi:hypothetical protein
MSEDVSESTIKRLSLGDWRNKMSNLNSLKTLLQAKHILSFKNPDEETINEMLDSRDSEDFENDWIRVFREIELREKLKPLQNQHLADIKAISEIAYKKTFSATQHSELAAYVADDFELIGKSLFLDFSDEWLNSLFLSYLQGLFPHSKLNPKPNGLELILETFSIEKLAA